MVPNSRLKVAQSPCVTPARRIAAGRSRLIQKHAQHAGIAASAKLDIDHFQPAGGRYPIRNFPYSINLKCHASNNLRGERLRQDCLCNEKVGLRPLCAPPNAVTTQQFSEF